ncbi:MAG: PD-(D/E)XK nuclease family protein [Bacteroidales bacterium]
MKHTFLYSVANYVKDYGNGAYQDMTVVLPNRRSCTFFRSYLNSLVEKVAISPKILPIDQWIKEKSQLNETDKFAAIHKLFVIYQNLTQSNENFDTFYSWGETLLNDFNEIDAYMLKAEDIFRNIADLKAIDNTFEYLSPKQLKIIEEFWGRISDMPKAQHKNRFLSIWDICFPMYSQLCKSLADDGTAYSGMISREVAENIETIGDDSAKIYFVGLNILNACEKKILRHFQKQNKALFFWDYDEFYVKNQYHEAGEFMRENLNLFPSPKDFFIPVDNIRKKEKNIDIIAASSTYSQLQLISNRLSNKNLENENFDNTAIILPDEELLPTALNAMPETVKDINITMGYPVRLSNSYSIISSYIYLQKKKRLKDNVAEYYYKHVFNISNHPILKYIDTDNLSEFKKNIIRGNIINISENSELCPLSLKPFLVSPPKDKIFEHLLFLTKHLYDCIIELNKDSFIMEKEAVFKLHTAIQRVADTLSKQTEMLSEKLIYNIIEQAIYNVSVPFEGEPLKGVQIMGTLETRALDFDEIFIPSMNEGNMPKNNVQNSIIPYQLRVGFGMPTMTQKDAVAAYYFYRLLQHPKKITLLYNASTDNSSVKEMSRFIYQLNLSRELKINTLSINNSDKARKTETLIQINSNKSRDILIKKYCNEKALSPSALNTYIDCSLKFYLKYIIGLNEQDEIVEEVDSRIFGNIFHKTAEILYSELIGLKLKENDLKKLITDKKIDDAILSAFREEIYKDLKNKDKQELRGEHLLVADYVKHFIKKMIDIDSKIDSLTIRDLEKSKTTSHNITFDNNESLKINIGGNIDRVDETPQGMRIIDYKTGKVGNTREIPVNNFNDLISPDIKNRKKEIFQTLLYSKIYSEAMDINKPIYPGIYHTKSFFEKNNPILLTINKEIVSYQDLKDEFNKLLSELLKKIFSKEQRYEQCEDKNKCRYCPFIAICNVTVDNSRDY